MKPEKIKPCPHWCKRKPYPLSHGVMGKKYREFFVCCMCCRGPNRKTMRGAIRAWNAMVVRNGK